MIDEIQVRNLALIQEASLRPSPGMTVITGETGAGKTALLASCKLLMGQRADHDLIREGEREAEVQGRLFLPTGGGADASEGVDAIEEGAGAGEGAFADEGADGAGVGERELVVDRRISSDGRSHVKMNGRMASVAELSSSVSPFVGLCSQHDQQMLARPAVQRRYLDIWAGTDKDGLLCGYQCALRQAKEARRALDEVRAATAASDARIEDARFKLRQIDAIGPTQDDYDELMDALRKSENAEMLSRSSGEARDALSGEGGVLDGLAAAVALLDDAARADGSLKAMAEALREATYVVEDVSHDVARYGEAIDLDVSMLDQMQERAAAYQSLLRSYGPAVSDVCAVADEARAVIEATENADAAIREAEQALARAEEELARAAEALHAAREAAAPGLSAAATAAMAKLEMDGAELVVAVEELPRDAWAEAGPDGVAFLFRPGAGMQARPLSRIASGGELSRVMLAIHAVMGSRDEVPTLVFDEIDAGVGGTAALALADVLAELSKTHQVIVVTHLAQVAAQAQAHYVAKKHADGGTVRTSIEAVEGEARTHEIARMLSGSITESSLAHARELQVL